MAGRLVVAHRTPPTAAACDELAAAGAQIFEIDVQLRHDELAVSHYLPAHGTRGRLEHDMFRFRRTPAQLSDPRFADAAAVVPADRTVLVDPKETDPARRRELTARLIIDLIPRERYIVSTPNPEALDELRAHGIRTWRTVRNPRELRAVLRSGRIEDEAVTVRHILLRPAVVEKLHAVAPAIVAWTVNSLPRIRQLQTWGVDGITTDTGHLMDKVL